MPKAQRKRVNNCDRHDFCLKPRSEYTVQPQYLQVSFCAQPPFTSQKHPQARESQPCLNGPVFNRDNNFATPTFVLKTEQNIDSLQGNRLKEDHQRRMVNYTDEKFQLNVPKPRTKNNYCSVCHHNYTDYLDHIQGHSHKKRINSTEFNRYILQLTNSFKKHHPISKPGRRILMKVEEPQSIDQSSIQIISNPNKRIKVNEDVYRPMPSMIPTRPMQHRVHHSREVHAERGFMERGFVDRGFAERGFAERGFAERGFAERRLDSQQQRMQSVQDTLSNFNFNINMNLYLNQLPMGINGYVPQSAFNPYLDFHCQNILMSQMNPMHHNIPSNVTGPMPGNMPPGLNMQRGHPNGPPHGFGYQQSQMPMPPMQQPQAPRQRVQVRPLNYIIIDE